MQTKHLYFVGMSKNCFGTLKKNLDFLQKFKENANFKVHILIIDSDSNDSTKEYCLRLKNEDIIEEFIEIDNLQEKYKSRIKRIVICRNEGLKKIKSNFIGPAFYIPMDMDMDLFKLIDIKKFINLLNYFNIEDIDALFPFSKPYYYDIFALRKNGWVSKNNIVKAEQLKKKFVIGSFFINYFYIIRKQYSPNKFSKNLISVESAFGGMAIYKINTSEKLNNNYKWNKTDSTKTCEHVYFNKYFDKKYILRSWNIETPKEHNYFKSLNYYQKFNYFLKTLIQDLINLNYKVLKLRKKSTD